MFCWWSWQSPEAASCLCLVTSPSAGETSYHLLFDIQVWKEPPCSPAALPGVLVSPRLILPFSVTLWLLPLLPFIYWFYSTPQLSGVIWILILPSEVPATLPSHSHYQLYPCCLCCSTGACKEHLGAIQLPFILSGDTRNTLVIFIILFMLILFRLYLWAHIRELCMAPCSGVVHCFVFWQQWAHFSLQHVPSLPWPKPNPFPAQILLRFDFFYYLFPLEKCINSPWLLLLGHRLILKVMTTWLVNHRFRYLRSWQRAVIS